jgi:hypothetical protein
LPAKTLPTTNRENARTPEIFFVFFIVFRPFFIFSSVAGGQCCYSCEDS